MSVRLYLDPEVHRRPDVSVLCGPACKIIRRRSLRPSAGDTMVPHSEHERAFLRCLSSVIIVTAEFLAGITANAFLFVMSCNDCIIVRKPAPLQILLICTALSRLGLQIVLLTHSLVAVFFPCDYEEFIYRVKMMFIGLLFSSTSSWFTACLSVFYCLKITVFTQSCFLWLKVRVAKPMLWLLLGGVLASLSSAAICIGLRVPVKVFGNASEEQTEVEVQDTDGFLLLNLTLIIPLAVFTICISMLFISLYKHTRRMQRSPPGPSNVKKEAHINALKTAVSFFCFFLSYLAAFTVNMTFKIPLRSHQFFVMKEITAAFPAGHSIIIILSNS
ncbi:taste receptor type 2 member 1-like [Octodon degus]|uniref:Taste receptor type 2 n=1 Tax=Octodon degus TaxID=10160 RepID=A0A6P3FNR8_OCTDE|nr:taste receptor type 2 member 1-like [Octodon degus]